MLLDGETTGGEARILTTEHQLPFPPPEDFDWFDCLTA